MSQSRNWSTRQTQWPARPPYIQNGFLYQVYPLSEGFLCPIDRCYITWKESELWIDGPTPVLCRVMRSWLLILWSLMLPPTVALYASIALDSRTPIFAKCLLLPMHWQMTHELSGTPENIGYGKACKGLISDRFPSSGYLCSGG